MRVVLFALMALSVSVAWSEPVVPAKPFADSAITRVDNCVCYKKTDAPEIKPWDIDWDDSQMLKKLISHCVCQAEIDMQKVENPRRYIVPGAELK